MSTITIFIAAIALIGYLIFQGMKSFQLRSLNTGLEKKDSEMVERIADMSMTRRLLGQYVCDLYKLRVYYITRDEDKFEEMLRHMIETEYTDPADKKSFLETYFHTFLIKGNRKYADWLLEAIRKTGDEKFIRYNEESYSVMMDKKSDLIDKMVEDVNSKLYYGFALGVILFMVAKQPPPICWPKAPKPAGTSTSTATAPTTRNFWTSAKNSAWTWRKAPRSGFWSTSTTCPSASPPPTWSSAGPGP